MQIWIHDNKMKKIVALNNDIPDMMSYTNSSWHSYLDQATSTFDFTIPKFSNGELHEDLKLINDECFVSFYVNGSYQVFYIATLQEDDFNIQLTCNNTNLEYALEYANPFNSSSAQTIEWYLNQMELLAFAAVEIGNNEIPDRKRTLTFDSQETKMNRLQSLMSKFEAEFEFKVELNRDGTYKRIVINIYQEADDTHHGIGADRKDVVLYYSNGLKGVQVTSDKTQMFNAGVFTGKDGLNLADVEISEKNADGIEEFYSRKGDLLLHAPLSMQHYPATMKPDGQDNWIRKDFTTEYENVNDLKAYALRTIKKYAYPLVTYTASVQSSFVSHYTDLKLGDTIRIIDKNFVGGLALEARVSEMIISFDNPANNSFVFTNYRKLDNKPSSALQLRIEQVVESRLSYRIELATTGGVTFKNNEGETIIKPSLYKGNLPWTKDVTWHWTLNGVVTDGVQYRIQARDITDTAVLTVDAFVGGKKVATTELTLTNVNDGLQGPQGPQGDEGPQGPQGDTGNGIANTVVTYGLSMSDTTEPATWSSEMPALVKGMYLWTRTVIIYTNGESTTSYQISYIPKDADATAEIDKTKQELLEKLETVRDDSLAAVEEAKQQLETVRDESLAAAEEAKQDLANVNTKVDSAKAELTQTKQELTTVSDDLSKAKTDLQNAVSAVDTKATNLKSDLSQAKQDLASQAQQLQAQANAQSELTKRVSSVEKTADGTKTTVNELTKTVAQNGKDITSVTARTKIVEDDLAGTKTTLSQVKTTADSTSQKTATLETGLNGLSARFDSLSVGGRNLLVKTNQGKTNWSWRISSGGTTAEDYDVDGINAVKLTRTSDSSSSWDYIQYNGLLRKLIEANTKYTLSFDVKPNVDVTFWAALQRGDGGALLTNAANMNKATANKWTKVSCVLTSKETLPDESGQVVYLSGMPIAQGNYLIIKNIKLEKGNVATDYSPSEVDFEQKVAEYKQTADQNYASLQTTVQNLDGTVQHNKTVADQTAQGFSTRIESLETYKDGESERANAYFESAKTETAKQLTAERTAIAKDYVAKSTYTSDVTGIRNELSATTTTANTTKTNLANYQASNDKVVASLKSSLQTTDGNVSNLQTKVEAVPGQITSAVSAVEGKIPTSVGGRNLWIQSKVTGGFVEETLPDNHVTGQKKCYRISNNNEISFNIEPDFSPRLYQKVTFSAWVKYENVVQGENNWNKFNVFKHNFTYHNSKTGASSGADFLTLAGYTGTSDWKYVHFTVDYSARTDYDQLKGTLFFNLESTKNGTAWVTGVKIEIGSIPSDYSPAPEDTISQISNLSSQIKQTADGITLLATKTELNNAKNELQSGINTATNKANNNAQTISTHTTQISALNTGLQAKVSQTDFNTLSGRVTTAENNITAKANELSSKITSVEGKIPTSVGGRNLWIQSKVTGGFVEETLPDNHITGQKKCYRIPNYQQLCFNIEPDFSPRLYQKVTFSAWVKYENVVQGDNSWNKFNCFKHDLYYKNSSTGATSNVNHLTLDGFTGTSGWKYITYTYDYAANKSYDQLKTIIRFNLEDVKSGTAWVTGVKVETGSIPSDYSPAPEDTTEQISSLSSEIKQTADGMTLLATKTELNTAKNELQSGINTATSKADNAQFTANSNAQTISTHTTQISALNSGLSAKVSQTDFNTLSGRVTTAENNITAKANELSSKITAVEGKIPTNVGGRNLLSETNQGKTNWSWNISSGGAIIEDFDTYGVNAVKMARISDASVSWSYIQYSGLIRKLIEPDTKYTLSFDVYPTENVTFWAALQRGDGGALLTNAASMNKALANKWTKVSCVLTSKATLPDDLVQVVYLSGMPTANGNWLIIKNIKLEKGVVSSDWSPAPEDTAEQISNLSSEIKQTADGITLLATKTELNSAKSELQSGITTATNKADTAQNTANSNAQTINTHTTQISALNTGLQAKVSQTDFNTLSGRVTTAENNITAKANELSSKITSVEGKIPTSVGGRNLLAKTNQEKTNWSWVISSGGATVEDFDTYGVNAVKMTRTSDTSVSWSYIQYSGLIRKLIEPDTKYTLSFDVKPNVDVTFSAILQRGDGGSPLTNSATMNKALANKWAKVSCVLTTNTTLPDDLSQVVYLSGMPTANGNWLIIKNIKLEKGVVSSDWSPAPEDTISQISSLSSELKQTTDAIKASVSSLDGSTVKSSSLTINADGIVMKAGKSTTDVANAIGSYFAVNQNAINLFSDKINVKGSMIVDGAITGDKIQANSVDVSKISGLDANFIKSKVEYAMIDWLKGKTIVADNGATKIDLLSGYINFDSDTPAIRRVTPGIPTQFMKFLKSDDNSVTTIGSNRDGSESSMNDSFAGIKITSGDLIEQTEIISDQIYFFTGAANRQGWQMTTVDGGDHRQVTLIPSGNPTKSNIYASDYFIRGSNRWVNLLDFINYFNVCLGHLQNLTGRYDIFKPFVL